MKQYAILDITNSMADGHDTEITLVQDGDTREEAIAGLADTAEIGRTYIEVRQLGSPIVPQERKAISLTRVKAEDLSKPFDPPDDPPVEAEPSSEPAARRKKRGATNPDEE